MKTRLCSGAIPIRLKRGKLQVLIVKSSSGKCWTFPKGGVEAGLSFQDNALKEVAEESGALGKICGYAGIFTDNKNKITQIIHIFYMQVFASLSKYNESEIRKRKWILLEDAVQLFKGSPYEQFLTDLYLNKGKAGYFLPTET